jgi:hypothetical protein
MTITDTPVQCVTHSASHDYAAEVTTKNTRAALAGVEKINRGLALSEQGRHERDAAIVRMVREDGMRVPEVARELGEGAGLSVSNIRTIVKLATAREGH